MSGTGLNLQDVVNVTINLTPKLAQQRNFGNFMILGDSDVIDTTQRYRLYTGITQGANDFGTNAPEYKAMVDFFAQSPQPAQCYVGRWARTNTAGRMYTGIFSATQQAALLATMQAISNGSFTFTVDGAVHNVTGMNFSAPLVTNLNGIASVINTAIAAEATCVWNATQGYFQFESETQGTGSAVSVLSTEGTGTDISVTLFGTVATGATVVNGVAAETALACVQTFDNLGSFWYAASFAASVQPSTADYLAISSYFLADSTSHVFGITTQDSTTLNSAVSTDLASQLSAMGARRTFIQYSSTDPYAICSFFGRSATVDFSGSNTTLTMKFKVEPNVIAETLTESQAAALNTKNCNVFVNYNNATAIIQQGVMSDGTFFDTVVGTDWLQNAVQNAVYNLLLTMPKVSQTDSGVTLLIAAAEQQFEQAVTNGLLAPGQWNGPSFGQLLTGQYLTKGYYTYAPPVASQTQAQRATRVAPPIQAAIKGAGAIHFANVAISFNP